MYWLQRQWWYLMSQNAMKWRIDEYDAQKNAYYSWWWDDNDFPPIYHQQITYHIRCLSVQQCTPLSLRESRTTNSTRVTVFVTWSVNFFGLRSRKELPSLKSVSREWWWLVSTSSRTSRNTMTRFFCVYSVFCQERTGCYLKHFSARYFTYMHIVSV